MNEKLAIGDWGLDRSIFDFRTDVLPESVFKGWLDPQYGNAMSGVIAYATPEPSQAFEGSVELRSSAFGGWVGNEHDARWASTSSWFWLMTHN